MASRGFALAGSVIIIIALAGRTTPASPPAVPAASETFTVRILSPLPTDTVIGRTDVVLEVTAPAGATVLKVELYAEDHLVTTLLEPPWKFSWDAGDSLRARTLRARAYVSTGDTASARVTTRAITGAERAHVTLVEVYCTVRNEQGDYLMDLGKEDFTVLESGKPQQIAVFSAGRKPMHLVLLIDTSASMKQDQRIEIAREAAAGFVEALEPADSAALVAFSDAPRLLTKATTDKTELNAALESIEATGGTALYDSILAAVDQLKTVEGKKAIVLLSDGRDESADGLGPGSFHTFDETLDAVLKSETAIYAIGTGEKLEEEPDFEHRRTVGEILDTLSGRSGGRSYYIKRAGKLKEAYRRIEDELRHQYTLAYYPPGDASEGPRWRPIEIKVNKPRARVTSRSGYFSR